ncbi:RDD family protein [Myceligenerans crystallogenes]|uniref:RDD domain-containing protein n=1 Tax=Myceligenerans crystallogenes TaxID=316335 RepID=A0ABN2NDV7_9MICO
MTTEDAAAEPSPDAAGGQGVPYASWGARVVAALLDNGIVAGVAWLAGTDAAVRLYFGMAASSARVNEVEWPAIAWPLGVLAVILVVQGVTGWTPGKLVTGIRVVDGGSGRPAGAIRVLGRQLWHFLDAICFLGYLRPLVHERRRTIADSITGTVVVEQLPRLPRRPRIAIHAAALVVCALGIGYGYVPISGAAASGTDVVELCDVENDDPRLTSGEVSVGGEILTESDRRLWTVRSTATAKPRVIVRWNSDQASDSVYRIKVRVRPLGENDPSISNTWRISRHRGVSPHFSRWSVTPSRIDRADGDVDTFELRLNRAPENLGQHVRIDVRVLAGDDELMTCSGTMRPEGVSPV